MAIISGNFRNITLNKVGSKVQSQAESQNKEHKGDGCPTPAFKRTVKIVSGKNLDKMV